MSEEANTTYAGWLVCRNGETTGPLHHGLVAQWVRGGMVDAVVRDCSGDWAGGRWVPISASPFADQIPRVASPWVCLLALLVGYFALYHVAWDLAEMAGGPWIWIPAAAAVTWVCTLITRAFAQPVV